MFLPVESGPEALVVVRQSGVCGFDPFVDPVVCGRWDFLPHTCGMSSKQQLKLLLWLNYWLLVDFSPRLECCTPLIFLHIMCTAWPCVPHVRDARPSRGPARPQLKEGIEQTEVEAILTSRSSGVVHGGWMTYLSVSFNLKCVSSPYCL